MPKLPKSVQWAQRREQAAQLRAQNFSYEEIAAKLRPKSTRQSVHRMLNPEAYRAAKKRRRMAASR